jgi:hypothetical protein
MMVLIEIRETERAALPRKDDTIIKRIRQEGSCSE